MRPGEVVVLQVCAEERLADVFGTAFGRRVPFWEEAAGCWYALLGIDLTAKPQPVTVTVSATTETGLALIRSRRLLLSPRRFPVRRLRVPSQFVEPPPDVLPRILAERDTVERVVADVSDTRFWTEAFVAPVSGAPTSSFGQQTILNGRRSGAHRGVDFRAPLGTLVTAPNAGRVALVADHYLAGRVVILDHGRGLYSYLAHLSDVVVAEDALVARGDTLGYSGATGRVTGPHLHYSVRLGGARVDPLSLLAVTGSPR
jgi:murein DD-endopeptidase MepM/ murein hydrolase activator NlpD